MAFHDIEYETCAFNMGLICLKDTKEWLIHKKLVHKELEKNLGAGLIFTHLNKYLEGR